MVLLYACGTGNSASAGAESGPLKVGLVVPVSGPYAAPGISAKNGFTQYLQTHGNKLGGRQVDLVLADEGTGPATAVPAVQRLLTQDQVDVVSGVINSAVAMGIRDMIDRAKKVLVVSTAGADALTCTAKSDYIWRTSFANSQDGAALGKHLATTVSPPNVYGIAPDYSAGHEHVSGFVKEFEANGGKIVGTAFPAFGTTRDYQPYLSGIQVAAPSATWAFFAGAEAVQFVRQYSEFGLSQHTPLYGNNSLTEAAALAAEGDAAVGVSSASYYDSSLDNPANKSFVAGYQAAYGTVPDTYAMTAYDAAAVLDLALTKSQGDAAGDALSSALGTLGTIGDSPRGPWHFDANHNPVQDFKLYKVEKTPDGVRNVEVSDLGTFAQVC